MQLAIIYWWICLAYARYKAAQAKALANAKYAPWDNAHNKAVWAGKGQYEATVEAVRATRAHPAVLKIWEDVYNKEIAAGVRKYTAGTRASAAARKAAHQ